MSFFIGENFPMIHSAIKRGIDKIRYPITQVQTRIKRIISKILPEVFIIPIIPNKKNTCNKSFASGIE